MKVGSRVRISSKKIIDVRMDGRLHANKEIIAVQTDVRTLITND